jgi:hypothetical protein
MKSHVSHIILICSATLLTSLPLSAQNKALPAATPPVSAGVSQEAKEKAEDAALLQQLDSDQPPRNNAKQKGQWSPNPAMRGGGGVGVAAAAPYRLENLAGHAGQASRALVIRTSVPEPKAQAALEEDLSVMSHILNKALEELPGGRGNANKVLGIDIFSPGATPLRSLYLDNYGAVFFLGVNFPLIAPAEKPAEVKHTVGDSVWEDAYQEVYGQRQGNGMGESGEDYSQEKVDKLKDLLFESLKNATNIRGLKPEEFVTVWVSGGTSSGRARVHAFKNNSQGNNFIATEPVIPARRTVLTVRASKSDIDAYAKGKLSTEGFQKHALVTAYTGDSGTAQDGLEIGNYVGRARF